MEKISWGIIGCGNVTEVKSGPAFQKVPDSSLVAVMRRDADKAADYAKRHRVPKWYNHAEDLIADPDVTAIYIAAPPVYHEKYAIAALEAGKPVYVEKPFSTNLRSCYRIKEFAGQSGIPLSVAHYRRALPKFLAIKKILEKEELGKINTVHIRMQIPDQSEAMASRGEYNWRVIPAIAGGGIFFDLAPHQLDLLVYFFGEAVDYKGIAENQAGLYAAEDTVSGTARMSNGIQFSGQWCFCSPDAVREDLFEITGTGGKMTFSTFGHDLSILTVSGEEKIDFTPPAHIQQPMIEKVTQYFLGKGPNPCTAEDAIQSFVLMDAFTREYYRKD
ncbi:MAG: Gfo/Idh/MocA family protein [Sediminibacterium sp.]